jgi:inner membrane protein
MDSLTQVLLGSAVGYAVSGRTLGKSAIVLGGIAGLIPDLDFIPFIGKNDPYLYLYHHRGLTHSLLFTLTAPFLFAWLCLNYFRRRLPPTPNHPHRLFSRLWHLFFWGISTHILLDCFTSWGTQVFWPHPYRVSWDAIFIVDLGYTVPLLIGVIVSYCTANQHRRAQKWVLGGLLLSTLYLTTAVGVKQLINYRFEALFTHHNISWHKFKSRPSPFNIILWSATAESNDHYYYAMISLFDSPDTPPPMLEIPKTQFLPDAFNLPRVHHILSFTQGFYTISENPSNPNQITIHDLRYGFLSDPWLNPPEFVFSYQFDIDPHLRLTTHNPRPQNPTLQIRQLYHRLRGRIHLVPSA